MYALGALPGDAQAVTLRTALQDSTADVRWNAAVGLARHGRSEGLPVIKQMMDRSSRGAGRQARGRSDGRSGPDCRRHDQRRPGGGGIEGPRAQGVD